MPCLRATKTWRASGITPRRSCRCADPCRGATPHRGLIPARSPLPRIGVCVRFLKATTRSSWRTGCSTLPGTATLPAIAYVEVGAPVDLTDADGNTLLMLAAYHDQPDTVTALAAQGADVNALNHRGQSPLARAVFKQADAVIAALLAAGADPDAGTPSARATAAMFWASGPLLPDEASRAVRRGLWVLHALDRRGPAPRARGGCRVAEPRGSRRAGRRPRTEPS